MSGHGDAMRTRGTTLLELLIALSLVVAMAALSLPAVMRTLQERNFDAVADAFVHQLRLARAHAQLEGRPVEVGHDRRQGLLEARFFEPAEDEGPEFDADGDDRREAFDGRFDSREDALAIAEGWARRTLGQGVTLSRTPPEPARQRLEEFETFEEDSTPANPLDDDSGSTRDRLVVFMADGTALFSEPLWLSDEAGRVGRVSVNAFTGLPRFERLEDLTEPPESPMSADEQDNEDFEEESDR